MVYKKGFIDRRFYGPKEQNEMFEKTHTLFDETPEQAEQRRKEGPFHMQGLEPNPRRFVQCLLCGEIYREKVLVWKKFGSYVTFLYQCPRPYCVGDSIGSVHPISDAEAESKWKEAEARRVRNEKEYQRKLDYRMKGKAKQKVYKVGMVGAASPVKIYSPEEIEAFAKDRKL